VWNQNGRFDSDWESIVHNNVNQDSEDVEECGAVINNSAIITSYRDCKDYSLSKDRVERYNGKNYS
jgi:hypothetical protein